MNHEKSVNWIYKYYKFLSEFQTKIMFLWIFTDFDRVFFHNWIIESIEPSSIILDQVSLDRPTAHDP